MNALFWLPALIPITSFLTGVVIFFFPEKNKSWRAFFNLFNAVVNIILVGLIMKGVLNGVIYEFRFPLFMGFDIVLNADSLSLLFVSLSVALWLLTTIYAIGYLKGVGHQNRFFGFFSLCVCATTGIALAGNLFTLLIFYEFLTLSTYPLIVHMGTPKAIQAGRVYLAYTLSGGVLLLLAMVWLSSLAGAADFVQGGIFLGLAEQYYIQVIVIFFLLIVGFGIKAALVPLHGWLPQAMVALAPVSALLHAVAVVKAGAFGIMRVVYDIYGIEFAQRLGVLRILLLMAAVTILYGSLRALFQDDLKRRLAYSTVSQVSYILLGIATVGPVASMGGIVHLVHQGVMKITLFFCAGNFIKGCHITRISQMRGIGQRMPLTMGAFTIAALGMIGIPPMAGFISKWFIALGALQTHQSWVVLILLLSSLLNAAYFLPIIYTGWFAQPDNKASLKLSEEWMSHRWALIFPPLITAALTLSMGLLAGAPVSPLTWTRLIVWHEFGE